MVHCTRKGHNKAAFPGWLVVAKNLLIVPRPLLGGEQDVYFSASLGLGSRQRDPSCIWKSSHIETSCTALADMLCVVITGLQSAL